MVFKKGYKQSEQQKRRIGNANRISLKGRKWTPEAKRNWLKSRIGLKVKYNPNSGFQKGEKHWNYKDGRSKILSPSRYGDDWTNIRKSILIRDNFTCQKCFIKNVRLDIHHKIPFLLTFDNSLNNLITLCMSCHKKEDIRINKELKKQEVKE